MTTDLVLGSPLADALNVAIQNKIDELGWANHGTEGSAMSEYFILLLSSGKTQTEIATEISGDILGLGPEDQTAPAFVSWLFEQATTLSAQHGGSGASEANGQGVVEMADSEAMETGFEGINDSPSTELHA